MTRFLKSLPPQSLRHMRTDHSYRFSQIQFNQTKNLYYYAWRSYSLINVNIEGMTEGKGRHSRDLWISLETFVSLEPMPLPLTDHQSFTAPGCRFNHGAGLIKCDYLRVVFSDLCFPVFIYLHVSSGQFWLFLFRRLWGGVVSVWTPEQAVAVTFIACSSFPSFLLRPSVQYQ